MKFALRDLIARVGTGLALKKGTLANHEEGEAAKHTSPFAAPGSHSPSHASLARAELSFTPTLTFRIISHSFLSDRKQRR